MSQLIVFTRKIYQAGGILFLGLLSSSSWATEAQLSHPISLSQGIEPSGYFGQILVSLAFILLIIFFGAWMLKRFGKVNGLVSKNMRVLGNMAVGQRERVLLIEVGKEQLLIGVTASKITLLHQLEERIEVEETKSLNNAFAQRLQEAMSNRNKE